MNGIGRFLRLTRARIVRQRLRAMPWDVRLFRRRVRSRVPISAIRSGPLVSVILVEPVAARIGAHLAMLERTAYRPIEAIVIGDPDDGARAAAARTRFDVRWVTPSRDDDRGPSLATAVADARGELVCLLDGAVEPLFDDWLGHLVESLQTGAVAAMPVIIRRAGRGFVRARQRTADLTLLSAGIDFERANGVITPRHIAVGRRYRWDPGDPTPEVPAASLACIVMRRADLLAAGGVPAGYRRAGVYTGGIPFADADVSAGLRATGGRIVADRRAIASCAHEDPLDAPLPRRENGRDLRAGWETADERARFLDRWGPRLTREVLIDAVNGTHAWSPEPLRIARIGELRLPGKGGSVDWHAVDVPTEKPWTGRNAVRADVLIVSDPDADVRDVPTGLIRVAWVGAAAPDHLDDFDIVVAATDGDRDRVAGDTTKRLVVADLAGPHGAIELRAVLDAWLRAPRIGIRIGPSKWKNAYLWGDFHFARALQRYLERAGHPTRVRLIVDWASAPAAMDDATLHLFGNQLAYNRPSQVNLLWQISHPDMASGEMYDTYDHAFVASDPFAARMAAAATIRVEPLHQATDPERFYPDPSGPHHELLFVANYRPDRPIVDWLVPTERDLAIYGRAWDEHGLDPRYLRGSHIQNRDLRRYYGSAAIVLNDTWEDMREAGFISNRIYDALACGAFVLSDDVPGVAREFDDGVAIYRDAAQLRAAVERFLGAPELRHEVAERGRAAVLARHTFEQRAAAILAAMGPLLESRPPAVSPAPTAGTPTAEAPAAGAPATLNPA
jgi:glycosyltransferase involved in cell wall biosynthesis